MSPANPIPINIVVEDSLSEGVLRALCDQCGQAYAIGTCYMQGGFGYLVRTVRGFNAASKWTPHLMLRDLDNNPCPPDLLDNWLSIPKHHNLILRIAVREIESWVLADSQAVAAHFGVSQALIPAQTDDIPDPKVALIDLARRSRSSELRSDIVPPNGSVRKQGPNYNNRLLPMIRDRWSLDRARQNSTSLDRAASALASFSPI